MSSDKIVVEQTCCTWGQNQMPVELADFNLTQGDWDSMRNIVKEDVGTAMAYAGGFQCILVLICVILQRTTDVGCGVWGLMCASGVFYGIAKYVAGLVSYAKMNKDILSPRHLLLLTEGCCGRKSVIILPRSGQVDVERLQTGSLAKDFGPLSWGVVGALMLVIFCPISIVALFAPYWKMQSQVATFQVSLWRVTTSTKMKTASTDIARAIAIHFDGRLRDDCHATSLLDDCGKMHAAFFCATIAMLLSLVSGIVLVTAFSPVFKQGELRKGCFKLGLCVACLVLLYAFLGICVVASMNMAKLSDTISLSGAGFAFLVLEFFLATVATVLGVVEIKRFSQEDARLVDVKKERASPIGKNYLETSVTSRSLYPTLLTGGRCGGTAGEGTHSCAERRGE